MLQLQLLVLVLAACSGLAWLGTRSTLSAGGDRRAAERAFLVAEAIASSTPLAGGPDASATSGPTPTMALERTLDRARRTTRVALLDLVNRHGVVVLRAGAPVGPAALDREASTAFARGSWSGTIVLGNGAHLAAAGILLRDRKGAPTGSLVVAISPAHVSAGTVHELVLAFEALALALAVGSVGSMLVTRWLRAQTFGLELDELTNLIREQEAMFHGIREAVVGLDESGLFQFANAEGCRLLHLPSRFVQRPATVLLPKGRMQDILVGRVEGKDLVAVHDDRILVMNRRPVAVGERLLGYVVTLVDRTESEALLRELDGMLGLTEALRAQAHDFSNRLHTIVGLIELGATGEAARFATDLTVRDAELAERLRAEVGHPMLVALLLAKSAVAAERGVQFCLGSSTPVPPDLAAPTDVLTVVGNLVDNAIEATQGREPAWVEVRLSCAYNLLEIEVRDCGPGVPTDSIQAIFVDGYSTKMSSSGARRGLGLALVRQLTRRRGGSISVTRDVGAVFTVLLPLGDDGAPRERVASAPDLAAGIVG